MARTHHTELLDFGESRLISGVSLTLIPAGHILGSAQVRLEHKGEVWVVSGDYKTEPDPTCSPFEPVRCHTFITESTFGLPIYRWCRQEETFADMRAWWLANKERGKASSIYAYALGKAQRILAGMLGADIGPVYTHGAVERLTVDYRDSGIALHQHRWGRAELARPLGDSVSWTPRDGERGAAVREATRESGADSARGGEHDVRCSVGHVMRMAPGSARFPHRTHAQGSAIVLKAVNPTTSAWRSARSRY